MVRVTSDTVVYSFSPEHPPVASVASGSSVLMSTADCFRGQIRDDRTHLSQIDRRWANPATGPIAVQEARPGDTLAVEILELSPASWGVTVAAPGMGLLGHKIDEERTQVVSVDTDSLQLGPVRLPVRPMLGVIGVAPPRGSVPTVTPGPHGGNLDCTLVGPGATVYLPIAVPGALFAAGDMHAAMGDGEISGTGIEVPGTAMLRLSVRRDLSISTPWVETTDRLAVIVSAPSLDDAAREAAEMATDYLAQALGISMAAAYVIAGAALCLRICQVVNPLFTVRAEIPKLLLPPRPRRE